MKPNILRSLLILFALVCGLGIASAFFQTSGNIALPSSKLLLEPVPGNPQPTNSFASAVALSPHGKYLAILCNGYGSFESDYRESIAILDLASNKLTDYPDARLARKAHQTYFYGLAFGSDGRTLYASMGSITDPIGKSEGDTGNVIAAYGFEDGRLTPREVIPLPSPGISAKADSRNGMLSGSPAFPAGITVFHKQQREMILAANNLADSAMLIDPAQKQVVSSFPLHVISAQDQHISGVPTKSPGPTSYPFATAVTRDGATGFVSLWNASRVAEVDLERGTVRRFFDLHPGASKESAGSHPTALLLSPDETRLYVALANTDEVAVINRTSGSAFYLSTKLPGQQYGGNYPIALAITPEGRRLFVANASSDAIAVFNDPQPGAKPAGFIPTDWYPTALAVSNDDLFIATGKGRGTGPNKEGTRTPEAAKKSGYIATLLRGSVARIPLKDVDAHLSDWTQEVMASNLMRGNADQIAFASGSNRIKHVIYIIKENRSYDQVLGDLPVGDGDPSLVMYGQDITPNEHKLARQFGVLDNFYDSGEVSGDGHVWSTAAITSDYTEQTWEIDYRSKERTYDYEGVVDNRYPILEKIPDVNEPRTGYLWGNFARHGISYRHYGEFVSTLFCGQRPDEELPTWGTPLPEGPPCARDSIKKGEALPDYLGEPHGSASPWPWAIPLIATSIPTKPELVGHFDPRFPDFNLDFPDQLRADEFLNEFNGFVASRKAGRDTMPQFILLRLPNDHTSGAKANKATPAASIADNDLALGRVVEAVSHSPYWNDTALFVLEDDAQGGADHVDAHRSIAFVISRFSPHSRDDKPFVDHTFYTTVNTVHTMEVLLGVPPMNNNDARAAVMAPLFSGTGDQPPFTADVSNRENRLLYKTNPASGPAAKLAAQLDFSHADAADAGTLNAILWRNRMGNRPFPHTPGALFKTSPRRETD